MKTYIPIIVLVLLFLGSYNSIAQPKSLTMLRVTVIDHLGNLGEGANVTLYLSEADYRNSMNPVQGTQIANKRGVVTFKNLTPAPYFIDAKYGEKSNVGSGIQTDTLQQRRLNKVNTVIQ